MDANEGVEDGMSDEMQDDNDITRDVRNGFICAEWRQVGEGPILDFATMKRRQVVMRCDRPDGHKGDHVDSVLLVNWPAKLSKPAEDAIRSATPEELTAENRGKPGTYEDKFGDIRWVGTGEPVKPSAPVEPEELTPLSVQLYNALDRLRKNAQHIFDAKSVRDWCETLAESDAALEAYRTDSNRLLAVPVEERTQDNAQNLRYATQIAEYLHKNCYSEVTQWKPISGDLFGVLMQIDNMCTGVQRKPVPEERTAEMEELMGRLRGYIAEPYTAESYGSHNRIPWLGVNTADLVALLDHIEGKAK